jgi:hypothetical protein
VQNEGRLIEGNNQTHRTRVLSDRRLKIKEIAERLDLFKSTVHRALHDHLHIQLVSKKSGNENFPNVNLVLSICQLIVYLTIPIK